MRRSHIFEITTGILVLISTIFLLFFAFNKLAYMRKNYKDCYKIYGLFSSANGTEIGDSVKISGVDIGSITNVSLDKTAYVARIDMCINIDIELSIDSAATIVSSSVMGGKFINVSPGSDAKLMSNGDKLEHTQSEAGIGGIMDKIIGMFSK